ncbi:MAG: hypothetical protein IKI32_09180 [Lachnospiraceae bacterium]|nr:hypothetical protein [Lachnospiraceae bacterium]
MKIIVDTLGADRGADVIIRGALEALQEQSAYDLILAADPSAVEGFSYDASRVEILPALSFVTNDDNPREMVKGKQETSMVLSLEKLRDDAEVVAMITSGSTGCALVGACFHLGLSKGLLQPALASALPTQNGKWVILCDCGSNLSPKAKDLGDYARLSAAFAKAYYADDVNANDRLPKVGLVNVGQEKGKGLPLQQEAFELLSSMSGESFEFAGNIEGTDILTGQVDAAVCDGFTGNVILKALEKAGNIAAEIVEDHVSAKNADLQKHGSEVAEKIRGTFDYNNRAGAVFLGTKKLLIKAHGAATEDTITSCILQAVRLLEGGFDK